MFMYIVLLWIFGLLWFEHNFSSTQMRRLTNPALTRAWYLIQTTIYVANHREYPIRTDVVFTPNKFQAYRHKPLGQFSQISLRPTYMTKFQTKIRINSYYLMKGFEPKWFLDDLNIEHTLIKSTLYQLS